MRGRRGHENSQNSHGRAVDVDDEIDRHASFAHRHVGKPSQATDAGLRHRCDCCARAEEQMLVVGQCVRSDFTESGAAAGAVLMFCCQWDETSQTFLSQ